MKKLVGKWIGHRVLPAQAIFSGECKFAIAFLKSEILSTLPFMGLQYEDLSLNLNNEAVLNGIIISSQHPSSHNTKKYIIQLNGNAHCYVMKILKMIRQIKFFSQQQKVDLTTVAFDYPGVFNSTGVLYNKKILIASVIAVVNFLINQKNANPSDILLDGHSFGGALAILTAQALHAKGTLVCIEADRTFKDLSLIITNTLKKSPWVRFGSATMAVATPIVLLLGPWVHAELVNLDIFCAILGTAIILAALPVLFNLELWHVIFFPVIKKIIKLTDWEMDPCNALLDLKADFFHISQIKPSTNFDDEIISFESSLKKAITMHSRDYSASCLDLFISSQSREKFPELSQHSLPRTELTAETHNLWPKNFLSNQTINNTI